MLIAEAGNFAVALERLRERDREVIEPDLIHAMDEFSVEVARARLLLSFVQRGTTHDPAGTTRAAVASVVQAARKFATAFAPYSSSSMTVHQQLRRRVREAGRDHSEQLRRARDQEHRGP